MLGDIIGAVGNLGGALINKRISDKAHQYETHVEQRNRLEREKFAQNAIRWKVADARKAGIHPLAALGAPTISPSAHITGGGSGANPGEYLSRMGQDIGRAISAKQTDHQRQMMDLQLKNAQLDNEMKQIAVTSARRNLIGQVPPGAPGQTKTLPAEQTSHAVGKPSQDAGAINSLAFAKGPGGSLVPVPAALMKDRMEDDMAQEWRWKLENYIGPNFGGKDYVPPKKLLPRGYNYWKWNTWKFRWEPKKGKNQKRGRSPLHNFRRDIQSATQRGLKR
jgi:hypothetical protein